MPLNDLADVAEKCSDVLSEMQLDDVVQGLLFNKERCMYGHSCVYLTSWYIHVGVVTHQKETGLLSLSFQGDHVEQLCSDGQLPSGVKLGYMEGKRPVLPRSR